MKTRHVLLLIVLFASMALIFDACNLLNTDIMDRINMFANGLNNPDRSSINANFDSALTQNLAAMNTAWWAGNFPVPPDSNHLYAISLIDYSNPANVIATIAGPPSFNGATGLAVNAVFVMSKEGQDWFIEKLFLNGSASPLIY